MADIIGALRVTLGMDSAAFETGARKAEARAKTMQGRLGAVGASMKGVAAGLAGALSVDLLVGAAKAGLDYASSLGEVSQQLGVTTKDLQQYRYAATQAGISQDEMDAGLARLTRTIGQAAQGGKSQAATFEKLGVSIRDANGNVKTAGDLIPELADAMQKLGSEAERGAVQYELFGRIGPKFAALFAEGSKGINNLRDAAEKLGIVLSQTQIDKADETADKLAALQQVMSARIAGTVADNSDAIIVLANALERVANEALAAISALDRFAKLTSGRQFTKALDWVGNEFVPTPLARGRTGPGQMFDSQQAERYFYGKVITNRPTGSTAAGRAAQGAFPKAKSSLPNLKPLSGVSFFTAQDPAVAQFRELVASLRFESADAVDATGRAFARLPLVVVPPFATSAKGALSEMERLRVELVDETNRMLADLFPEESRIAELRKQMAMLDKALAEELIDHTRWFAARGRLAAQIRQLQQDIAEAEALVSTDDLAASIDAGIDGITDTIRKGLGDPMKETTQAISKDFATMASNILYSVDNLGRSIKSGGIVGILQGVLGLLATIGQATGGFEVGPFKFPGAPDSGGGIGGGAPGFATGGSFMVGGRAGVDANLVSFRATRGEMVNITRPGAAQGGGSPVFKFDLRGAVMTPDLLAQMNAIGAQAAQSGANLAQTRMAQAARRSFG